MARIRSVHPGLFIDDAFLELSMASRVCLIGIWVQADDRGIFEWRPKSLKAAIFPGDDVNMDACLKELVGANCIKQFDESGKAYGAVRNFCRYQTPRKPSYRHPFPEWCRTYVAFNEPRNDTATAPLPHSRRTSTEKSSVREKEKEKEREKDNSKTSTESVERESPAVEQQPPPSAPDSLSEASQRVLKKSVPRGLSLGTPLAETWTPDDELCEQVKREFGIADDDLRTEVLAFHAHHAQNGTLSANWRATFLTWAKRWKEHRDRQAPPRVEVNRLQRTQRTPQELSEKDWDGIVALYAQTGRWARDAGPDPMHIGHCKAPEHILRKHDIDLETGERRIPPRKVSA